MSRERRCTFEGHVYMIPDMWLAGRTTTLMHVEKLTAPEAWFTAVRQWDEQAVMAEEFEAQRR